MNSMHPQYLYCLGDINVFEILPPPSLSDKKITNGVFNETRNNN